MSRTALSNSPVTSSKYEVSMTSFLALAGVVPQFVRLAIILAGSAQLILRGVGDTDSEIRLRKIGVQLDGLLKVRQGCIGDLRVRELGSRAVSLQRLQRTGGGFPSGTSYFCTEANDSPSCPRSFDAAHPTRRALFPLDGAVVCSCANASPLWQLMAFNPRTNSLPSAAIDPAM